jgi:recombination protein RecR
LHLLKQEPAMVRHFGAVFQTLKDDIHYCKRCNNISDTELCSICNNPKRVQHELCVVEDIRDIIAIENTQQYNGLYHVLGGLISPMEGVGPNELQIESLITRLQNEPITEVIMALSATMEGDTTLFYIDKKIKGFSLKVTTLARGVAFGGELEYVDELTLGRSIVTRVPYESNNR